MTQRPFHEIYEPRIPTVTFEPDGTYTKHLPKESFLINPSKDNFILDEMGKYRPTVKVNDAIEGRREIPVGSGLVEVCVGFIKGRDEYGLRTETPLYKTVRC